jgi:hypothetical protein
MKKKVKHKTKIARAGLRTLRISLFAQMRIFDSSEVYHSSSIRAAPAAMIEPRRKPGGNNVDLNREVIRERSPSRRRLPSLRARK